MRGAKAEAGWHWLMSVIMIAFEALAHAFASIPAHGGSVFETLLSLAVVFFSSAARTEDNCAATTGVTVICSRNLRRFTNAPPRLLSNFVLRNFRPSACRSKCTR